MPVHAEPRKTPGRITRPGEYKRVYSSGRKVVGRYLILFRAEAQLDGLRVGITVSSKVGGSVVRNREKRRIREAVRVVMDEVPVAADIVFVALGRIRTATLDQICADMRDLVARAKL